jgi:hypothetical protein
VLPQHILHGFHFTFLIRHPSLSIPSLYKISTPPGSEITGWYGFHTDDTGYVELRKLFDYLKAAKQVGPSIATLDSSDPKLENGNSSDHRHNPVEICLIDAEDLLREPEKVCRAYCKSVGLSFDPSMLSWHTEVDQKRAEEAFQKSWAIHVDALNSDSLKTPKDVRPLPRAICPEFSAISITNFKVAR